MVALARKWVLASMKDPEVTQITAGSHGIVSDMLNNTVTAILHVADQDEINYELIGSI